MDKIEVFYDLITGILVSIDIAAPSLGQKAGKWIIKHLPDSNDTVNPLRFRTLLTNIFLTILTLAILVSYAIAKGTSGGATFNWSEVGLFVIGIIVGVFFVCLMTLIILLIPRVRVRRNSKGTVVTAIFSSPTLPQDASTLSRIWSVFLILGILAPLLSRLINDTRIFLAAPMLMFILTIWVLPTVMQWNRSFVNYVSAPPATEKPYYALIRVGLLVFIISKVVNLMML